jgi:hypothetical protein
MSPHACRLRETEARVIGETPYERYLFFFFYGESQMSDLTIDGGSLGCIGRLYFWGFEGDTGVGEVDA